MNPEEIQRKFDELTKQISNLRADFNSQPAPLGKRFTNSLVSTNFSSGVSGWKISDNGDVEFNDGTFRGTITIGSTTGQRVSITNNTLEFYNSANALVMKLQGATDFGNNQIILAGAIFGTAQGGTDANYDAGYKLWAGGFGGTGIATFLEARNNETATDEAAISIRTDGEFWHYGLNAGVVAKFTDAGALGILDGITAPGNDADGMALIYVDTADGDLKVRFSDGVVKTLATDV